MPSKNADLLGIVVPSVPISLALARFLIGRPTEPSAADVAKQRKNPKKNIPIPKYAKTPIRVEFFLHTWPGT